MKINEDKIMEILERYEDTIRSTGAFFIEIDDNELSITDACEGVDMMPLDKNICYKLSELFKELGDSL
jgi:predicted nucleic acid-binding protein